MKKTNYVAQLVFAADLKEVALLLKLKGPKSLIGKITGIGGKQESNQTPEQAATAETKQEADMDVAESAWTRIEFLDHENSTLTVFTAIGDLSKARTMEEEPIIVISVENLRKVAAHNPAALAGDLMEFVDKALGALSRPTVTPAEFK